MTILNVLIALIGFIGWGWVWVRSRYHTDSDCRTQVGVVAFGFVWIFILVTDYMQIGAPTGTSLSIRMALLIGMWCLEPKLHRRSK